MAPASRTATLLALACISLGAGASSAASTRADSGLTGVVLLGPTCPVQRVGQICERRFQTTIAVVRRNTRRLVKRFRSDRDGRFRVGLAPGRYTLEGSTGTTHPTAQPIDVTVRPHRFLRVTLRFDTGIR